MALYRTLNLTNNQVQYVDAINKAQARSHVAQKIIQVEVATPTQVIADTTSKIDVTPVSANA